MSGKRRLVVHRLGRVEYEDGLALQKLFGDARRGELVPDTLLLLEHPPILTLGRGATRDNILLPPQALAERGIEIFETSRGGEVTYHGPGQVVGYPIFLLSPDRQDVRKYVRNIEAALIAALARFGIRAGRIPRWPGVWLGAEDSPDARKIAAIGVHLSRWLTSHGFALNLTTHLSHFQLIVPCGISEAGVTSMARELPEAPPWREVETALAESFAEVFEATLEEGSGPPLRTLSVAVMDDEDRVLLLRRRPERGAFWQIVTGRIEPGESPAEAAAREMREETGQALAVEDLGYRHSFALGEEVPPRLVEETAFAARWPRGQEVKLSDAEHDAHRWVSVAEAMTLLPFQGLREAVRRARRER